VTKTKRVLFLCTHNSARSQMAEGILRYLAGDRYTVASAGHRPTAVHPLAVEVLAERGVDISAHRAKDVGELLGQEFDPAAARGTQEERWAAFRDVRDRLWEWIRAELVEGGKCDGA